METFAEFLKRNREKSNLTKAQLARTIGWTPMYYGRFESGDVLPTEANIPKFAKALNIDEKDMYVFLKSNYKKGD